MCIGGPIRTKELGGGLRQYVVPKGRILQGGVDAVRDFYRRAEAVEAVDESFVIVNLAAPGTQAEKNREQKQDGLDVIFWLPMQEANRVSASRSYLRDAKVRKALLGCLDAGNTVVVHCQEGYLRSVTFSEQLQAIAEAGHEDAAAKHGSLLESISEEADVGS